MEAHCIALELKYQNQSVKSEHHGQFLKEKSNEAKIKRDMDEIETINIELEHSVAKLLQTYMLADQGRRSKPELWSMNVAVFSTPLDDCHQMAVDLITCYFLCDKSGIIAVVEGIMGFSDMAGYFCRIAWGWVGVGVGARSDRIDGP
ncbi:hypothetical protein Tco_0490479 [Tanacetum coccineum]